MTWKCTNTPKGEDKLYSDAKGVVPSLDLRFAEGKNLNDYMTATPLVDHQRSMSGSNLSPGTFVNSSGLIETAKVNLIVYSEDFSVSSAWVAAGATPVQSTTVLAPNNLSFTYKLEENNTTGAHRFLSGSSNNIPAVLGNSYTFSFYAKNAGRDYAYIRLNTSSGDICAGSIRLSDATVTETSSGTITATSVGNGWVRIVGTGTSPATSNAFPEIRASNSAIYSNYTGDGTSGIYVWGAQLEEGTTATTYIPTTTVPSAAPRFDHDPTTGESLGLLVEESRTNSVLYSDGSSGWNNIQTVSNPSTELNPENNGSCVQLVATAATDRHTTNSSASSANTITVSVFVKKDTHRYAGVGFGGPGNGFFVGYDIEPGVTNRVLGTDLRGSATLVNYGFDDFKNNWVRIWAVGTTSGTGGTTIYLPKDGTAPGIQSWAATGTEAIFWYGAQFENNATFPTSYIPTTGTALTRSADVASITGSNFSSWYNQSEGTAFVDNSKSTFKTVNFSGEPIIGFDGFGGWFNSQQEWGVSYRYSVDTWEGRVYGAGSSLISGTSQVILPGSYPSPKIAMALSVSDGVRICVDGNLDVNNASITGMPTINQLVFQRSTPTRSTHISRFTYFPERLPDSSLQTMTTP